MPSQSEKTGLTIVVPVYRSEDSLPRLVERLEPVLRQAAEAFELVLVNDGSPDRSWEVIQKLSRRHAWIRGINLMRNFGQHNALLCGIRAARYGVIVTMDDDLQNPPEEVPILLAELAKGFDLVYGTPRRERHGLWRDLASRVTKLALQGAMGVETARRVGAFRAFRTGLREAFVNYQSPFLCIDVLLTWGGSRFSAVEVRHDPRQSGPSGYTLTKLITHALNMVTGFTTLPLRLASLTGFAFTLLGLLVLAYVLGRWAIQGSVVPGFAFLASAIAVFAGAQLFALGIIGEYLARMHSRMMERPTYVVQSTTEPGEKRT